MIGTLLCISCENEETAFVDLFASGVLFILRINVRQWLLNQCKAPGIYIIDFKFVTLFTISYIT